ncbi:MAG: hypothetical protein ACKVQK_06275, partial [Burkholderiales bacterium]
SPEKFKISWFNGTRNAAKTTNSITKLVLSFSTGEVVLGGNEAPFDLMLVAYFKHLDDLPKLLSTELAQVLQPGGDLVDASLQPIQIIADETLMAEREGVEGQLRTDGQLKVVRTVFKRHDINNAQFKDYWLQNHSRLKGNAIGSPGVKRIVATFAIPQGEPPRDRWHGGNLFREYRLSAQDVCGGGAGCDAKR